MGGAGAGRWPLGHRRGQKTTTSHGRVTCLCHPWTGRAYRVNFLYFTRVGSMLSGPSRRTLSSS